MTDSELLTPKTVAQQVAAHKEVIRIAAPYIAWQTELLSRSIPNVTISRGDDGVTMTTAWPPEVQEAVDQCASLCRQAVTRYLQQEGFSLSLESTPRIELFR